MLCLETRSAAALVCPRHSTRSGPSARAGWAGLLLLTASSFSATSLAAEVKITDAARKHFSAGVALLKDPDGARYEEAYREFKVAYEASPSWKILGNLGISAMKLERDGEAIEAFSRYLAEGKNELDPAERADIERDLGTLRASAVSLTLTITPGDASITDERTPVQGSPVRNRYQSQGGSLKLQIRPGHHVITATAEGKSPLTLEFDAEPGTSRQHTFDFAVAAPSKAAVAAPLPAPRPEGDAPATTAGRSRPIPAGVWAGVAATGVFAVGASVSGVMALGKNSDYQKANGQDRARAESLQSETKTWNLISDAMIAAAVISAGVTTVLYLKRPEADASGLEVRISPRVGLNQSGLSVEGAF